MRRSEEARKPRPRLTAATLLVAVLLFLLGLFSFGVSPARAFCSLPGTCQPTAYGGLNAVFLGPGGKPAQKPITLWVKTKDGKTLISVGAGLTGVQIKLIAADYTLRIEDVSPVIEVPITIKKGAVTNFKTAGFGKLKVQVADDRDRPFDVGVEIRQGSNKQAIAAGKANTEIDVPAGAYVLHVATSPPLVMKNFRINHGATKNVPVAKLAGLKIDVKGLNGQPLDLRYRLYRAGGKNRNNDIALASTGARRQHLPGTYDIEIDTRPVTRLAGIKLKSGKLFHRTLPRRGAIKLTVPDAVGKPLDIGIDVLDTNGRTIAKGKSAAAIEVGPGTYTLRLALPVPARIKGFRVTSGKVTNKKTPKLGWVNAIAVGPKGKPIKARVKIYPPGRRDKVLATIAANRPVNLLPGIFDFQVTGPNPAWYYQQKVVSGQILILKPLAPGQIVFRFKDPDGKALDGYPVWAFGGSNRRTPVKEGRTGTLMTLPSGAYAFRIATSPKQRHSARGYPVIAFRARIAAGKLIEFSHLPAWARLHVKKDGPGSDLTLLFSSPRKGQRKCSPRGGQVYAPGYHKPLHLPPTAYNVSIVHEPIGGAKGEYCMILRLRAGTKLDLTASIVKKGDKRLLRLTDATGRNIPLRAFTFSTTKGYKDVSPRPKTPPQTAARSASRGKVMIRVKSPKGGLIGGIPVQVYVAGKQTMINRGKVNKPISLAPGRYDLRLTIGPAGDWAAPMAPYVWKRGVTVTTGKTSDVMFGPWAQLALTRPDGASKPTLIVYHPDPRKKNCEDYRAKGTQKTSVKPFLNFPPIYLRKPALLPGGKYIVLVQGALKGAKRASMICLARPLNIKPGARMVLKLREVKDAKGPRLILAGYETRLVF